VPVTSFVVTVDVPDVREYVDRAETAGVGFRTTSASTSPIGRMICSTTPWLRASS
jgi:hypothetical protein